MNGDPSTNGTNGRAPDGRFGPGNSFGRGGNVHAARVSQLRGAMLEAAEPGDVKEIMHTLIGLAKGGDIAACRECLDRLIGKPNEGADLLERLEELETLLDGKSWL